MSIASVATSRGVMVLAGAVLVCVLLAALVWGCGKDVSEAEGFTAALVQPAPTGGVANSDLSAPKPVSEAERRAAVHDRILAEQGRGPSGTAADRVTTALITPPSLDAASSASAVPPAPTAAPTAATTGELAPVVETHPTTTVVLSGGQTPLRKIWGGTAEQLAAFLLRESPSPAFTVPASVLAGYYVRYCAEAGLRADLLWAQMIHETGYGRYGGDVEGRQNNYAGIGATGGGAPGVFFTSAEAGVMAHVAHMVAYVYESSPVPWADANTDPRFDHVRPRGVANVLADLNGRWAVPGTTYGEAIEAVVRAINAQ